MVCTAARMRSCSLWFVGIVFNVPHRKKSQGVRSGDLGGQSRRCSNLFERPYIYYISCSQYTNTISLHCSNEQPYNTLSNGCNGKAGVIEEHTGGGFQSHLPLFTTANLDSRIGNCAPQRFIELCSDVIGNFLSRVEVLCIQQRLLIRLINRSCCN